MKHLYRLAAAYGVAVLGLTALTGCEGSEMFSVNSPEGLSEKIDSIANSKKGAAPVISPTTLGATDNSSAWWAEHLNQDIYIESGKVYTTTFTNYTCGVQNYNNYVVVLRKSDKTEYAVLRSDDYGWGEAVGGDGCPNITHSNTASADWKAWLSEMDGARVTVTVTNYGDNTCDVVADVVGNQGTVSTQKYIGIPVEADNLYLDFTTDGCHYVFDKAEMDVTEAKDQQPVTMQLTGVPSEVDKGAELKDLTALVKAQVTYSDGAQKEVDGSELTFIIVPAIGTDENGTSVFDAVGERYIVATYGHTLMGKTADNTISASAKFEVVPAIKALTIASAPTLTTYKYYEAAGVTIPANAEFGVSTAGLKVQATYLDGVTRDIDLDKLSITNTIPMKDGKYEVTVAAKNGVSVTIPVTVEKYDATLVTLSPTALGAEDCSTAWWGAHLNADVNVPAGETRAFSFTNWSSGANNWNNFVVVLRNADLTEYAVVRSDNWGWGDGYGTCVATCTGGEDWATWLTGMNGAKVVVYVSNTGKDTADVVAVMTGTDGQVNTQCYYGVTIDSSDLNVDFTVDGSHLVFE